MARNVLVDTGPLVAILCREDAQHARCVTTLQGIRDQLVTCWPVLTEAVYLLGDRVDRVRQLLAMITSGAIQCVDLPPDAVSRLDEFYVKFGEHAPDLADAALVLLTDRMNVDSVFTLDQRDFAIYRTTSGRALQVIPAPAT
jgi:uncharacterized protein